MVKSFRKPETVSRDRIVVSPRAKQRLLFLLKALVIIAAVKWIYLPVMQGDWLMDDDLYLTGNTLLYDPARLWKAWFVPGSFFEYYPMEQSLQWFQWRIWGFDTLGYHVTNLLLHLVSALLVWRLLSQMGLRLAWLGGLLFAVHPTMVESVAWISEFKNTLSLPPFLLAMSFYLEYETRGKRRDYLLALGFFIVAMLCKVSMASFPFVILLYAWWKRGRIGWNDVKASAPFFFVSLVLGLLSVYSGIWFSQTHHAALDVGPLGGLLSRTALAGTSLAFYFWDCLWPFGLLPIYPQWVVNPPTPVEFLPWVVMAILISGLWTKRAGWGRHGLLGLGFFLILLGPFVTINVGGYTAFTWVMDHFLYIPIIGLIGLVVAALEQVSERLPASLRFSGVGILAGVFVFLILESRTYAGHFVNQETLWTYELQHDPDAWLARINLGNRLAQAGRIPEAMEQYEKVLASHHAEAETHNNLGNALMRIGRVPEAIAQFRESLKIKPDYRKAHDSLGNALLQTGQVPEAIRQYQEALRINPDSSESHYDLGNALLQSGQPRAAREQFEAALRINPAYPDAHNNLANLLMDAGDLKEAVEHYVEALQLNPNFVAARYGLGNALIQAHQWAEARDQLAIASSLAPDDADVHNSLGIALGQLGQISDAKAQFETALKINPDLINAQTNLARLQGLPATVPPQ